MRGRELSGPGNSHVNDSLLCRTYFGVASATGAIVFAVFYGEIPEAAEDAFTHALSKSQGSFE